MRARRRVFFCGGRGKIYRGAAPLADQAIVTRRQRESAVARRALRRAFCRRRHTQYPADLWGSLLKEWAFNPTFDLSLVPICRFRGNTRTSTTLV